MTNDTTLTLNHRQVFGLKLDTLEKRITHIYQETQNSTLTIKYVLALRVRCQLSAKEHTQILKELVRHLFLNTKVSRTMKRFFYYFQDYFMLQEWRLLTLKLFPVRNFTEQTKTFLHSQIAKFRPAEAVVS